MDIKKDIRSLRIIAFWLFIIPTVALLGSLIINNYLVTFKFNKGLNYNFKSDKVGESVKILCSQNNNYCENIHINFELNTNLGDCNSKVIFKSLITNQNIKIKIFNASPISTVEFNEIKNLIKNSKKEFFLKYEISDLEERNCILNHNAILFYNLFPSFFEKTYDFITNPKTILGTSSKVNPLIYGETSISNIVKRVPINYFFKPLLFLSVFCMLLYWMYYNKVLNSLFNNNKRKNYFYIFGILSAIFLFLHVFFLGWNFENEILTKLRRTYIIFFILFEVMAQIFLVKEIFIKKNQIKNYLNSKVVYLKVIFVSSVCFFSIIILFILIFYNLNDKVDYILEWNYFLLLLIFYLLSSFLWKKINNKNLRN